MDLQKSLSLVSKFDGKDFGVWRIQIRSLLESFNSDHVLTQDLPDEENKIQRANFETVDKKVRSILFLAIDNKYVRNVINCKTSKEIWTKLESIYAQKSQVSKTMLHQQFFDASMRRGESVTDYVSRIEYLVSQLADVGLEKSEEEVVGRIVSSLGDRYSSFTSSWIATDSAHQTLENLTTRLLAEEQLQSKQKPSTSALNVASKSRQKKSTKPNLDKGKKRLSKEEFADLMSKSSCHVCHQKGHWKKNCLNAKTNVKVAGALITDTSSEDNRDAWVLDTGATDHMSNDKRNFFNYRDLKEPVTVRYGDGRHGLGVGIDSLHLRYTSNSNHSHVVLLQEVLFVPGLQRKLMSLSKITDKGNCGEFQGDQILIYNGHRELLFVASKENGLYFAKVNEVNSADCLIMTKSTGPSLDLWHQRFGHLDKAYLSKMLKNDLVNGFNCQRSAENLPDGDFIDCEACKLGKQSKKTFPLRSTPRAQEVGERVHVDICGPIVTPSIANSHYFVLFKDECSGYRMIYFVNNRKEVFDTLRKAVVDFRNNSGKRIQKLISDRGSEFMSNRTQSFLLDNHITQETSAPHTPAQNGYIERDNKTVVSLFRTMLLAKRLPESLWAEAANTAVFIESVR